MGKTQATEEGAFDPVRTGETIPARLRPCCLYRRALLGDLARDGLAGVRHRVPVRFAGEPREPAVDRHRQDDVVPPADPQVASREGGGEG
jgi:hypothetical protein